MTSLNNQAISLFYSYSHQDEAYRQLLEKHLTLLQRQGVIATWHDRLIEAGELWETALKHHLDSAQLILLLISPDFIASDYCYDIEMKRALERHAAGTARVIPVALRPVDHQAAPFMQLQGLPSGFKPVTEWDNLDRAFADIASGIRQAASRFHHHPAVPHRL
jgi:hypothetical protein